MAQAMETQDENDRSYQPRWLRHFLFLGKPPPLTRRQWKVLGLVSVASFFDQYDAGLFSLALKQIQADLQMAEGSIGIFSSLITLGSLPAILLTWAADRMGRRRLLLATIVAYTILTGATAFAPNAGTFVVLQFFARFFITAEFALAIVVLGEELDDDARGWGIGALGALAACGHGLAFLLFALIEVLPLGWRSLYLVGLLPLTIVAALRRGMSETPHFERLRAAQGGQRPGLLAPILSLVRQYPQRFLALGSIILLLGLSERAAFFFAPKYLQDVHEFAPYQVGMMGFFGGAVGIFANTLAGRWSDRYGRKRLAIVFLSILPLLVMGFYNVWWGLLPLLWIGMLFSAMGGGILLATLGVELFPTSYRSTAAGARTTLGTIGAVAGLWLESILYGIVGSHWTAITILVTIALVAPVIMAFAIPETSGRSLDEISPER